MHAKYISAAAFLSATAYAAPRHHGNSRPTVVDDSCGNKGYNVAVFEHASPDGAKVPTDWDMHNMETLTPDYTTVTNAIGAVDLAPGGKASASIYGSREMALAHFGARHTGFFFAQTSGDYTVTMTGTDDAAYVFMGADCKKTGSNNLGSQVLNGAPFQKKINVNAGFYVPFDIRWANVMGGPYNLDLTITDPQGNVVLGKTAPAQNNLVTRLCNESRNKVWEATGLTQ